MQEPVKALTQSYTRTKARNYKAFRETMELHTNSSNNTIYADADGTIAYFHANFIPKRDAAVRLDADPVDGSDPATEWNGVLSLDETPNLAQPAPTAGSRTPTTGRGRRRARTARSSRTIPAYVETSGENARGIHAIRVLENRKDFTLDSLIAAAYDSYLTAFEDLMPALLTAYDRTPASNPLKAKVAEQIALLRAWDLRWSVVVGRRPRSPCSGARSSGRRVADDARKAGMSADEYMATTGYGAAAARGAGGRLRQARCATSAPGRRPGATSIASSVSPGTSSSRSTTPGRASRSASPPRGGARWRRSARGRTKGTKKIYGTSGNSFVAVVEFGDTRARPRP